MKDKINELNTAIRLLQRNLPREIINVDELSEVALQLLKAKRFLELAESALLDLTYEEK